MTPDDRAGAAYLELLPAIDIAGGRAVQAVQGVGESARFDDPLEVARRWQADGAEWIHVVDLDAAFGRGHNRAVLADMVGDLDIDVELSGGIRDDESLKAALRSGCRRVNLATAAVDEPNWCAVTIAEHGDRIAVGLDVRGRTLAGRGATGDGGDLFDVIARLDAAGCARYVITDVDKDGLLAGPNLALLRDVCAATARPVVASGGVAEPVRSRGPDGAGAARRRRSDRRQGVARRPVHAGRSALPHEGPPAGGSVATTFVAEHVGAPGAVSTGPQTSAVWRASRMTKPR